MLPGLPGGSRTRPPGGEAVLVRSPFKHSPLLAYEKPACGPALAALTTGVGQGHMQSVAMRIPHKHTYLHTARVR